MRQRVAKEIVMNDEALEFLKRAADGKHRIVSSGDLTSLQIVEAQACGRLYVEPSSGLGWALLPWELATQKDKMRESGFWSAKADAARGDHSADAAR